MHYQEPWTDMLGDAVVHLQSAERMQQRFFQLGHAGEQPHWEPPVDIYANGKHLGVLIALPGVPENQYQLGLENGILTVSSQRAYLNGDVWESILRLEIPYGRFQRQIPLPAGSYVLVDKVMKDGCLRLNLEKTA